MHGDQVNAIMGKHVVGECFFCCIVIAVSKVPLIRDHSAVMVLQCEGGSLISWNCRGKEREI